MTLDQTQEYFLNIERTCRECSCTYRVVDSWETVENMSPRPWLFYSGYKDYCLTCWLVGESVDANESRCSKVVKSLRPSDYIADSANLFGREWDFENVRDAVYRANFEQLFSYLGDSDYSIAVLPLNRVHVQHPIVFPAPIILYPPAFVDFGAFEVTNNSPESSEHWERASALSGIAIGHFQRCSLAVFPTKILLSDQNQFEHLFHLDQIRELSAHVDKYCLDFLRLRECTLESQENIPGSTGQFSDANSMAGMMIAEPHARTARIYAGSVFSQQNISGLGMVASQPEWDQMPCDGEVGNIIRRGMSMYRDILENSNPTGKFMQAMTLLEFLAFPDAYESQKDVRKVVARYVAKDKISYEKTAEHLRGFYYGKGLRCIVVHEGKSLTEAIPDLSQRNVLFAELDSYIKAMFKHMIPHSHLAWDKYLEERALLLQH